MNPVEQQLMDDVNKLHQLNSIIQAIHQHRQGEHQQ